MRRENLLWTAHNNNLPRIANCDWFPERNLIEVSVTKDAFCFLEQHLELHERFVNLITGGHIRGLEATKYRQNVPLSKGL
jgi:hypothetical protein